MDLPGYDAWKLRSPDDDAAYRLGYDPVAAAEAEDEWLWLDSIEKHQPLDEYDLDEMTPPIEVYAAALSAATNTPNAGEKK